MDNRRSELLIQCETKLFYFSAGITKVADVRVWHPNWSLLCTLCAPRPTFYHMATGTPHSTATVPPLAAPQSSVRLSLWNCQRSFKSHKSCGPSRQEFYVMCRSLVCFDCFRHRHHSASTSSSWHVRKKKFLHLQRVRQDLLETIPSISLN